MKLTQLERLSILACATGLALLAAYFIGLWLRRPLTDWLPMLVSAIAGFEMFMALDAQRRRRTGNRSNG